ncbi:glycerophosphodiester phosphodiesterase [Clostridium beijerinckii]|uniref:Glycerophosphoryl diester phosphodiesterase n=1 Tax=Clostridium beijerinckii TaxID=1520 RepID=A0AAX0B6R3_CLOBE|nr:glycerophosphodiester phosphodiesterase [Clostridium beijerinckii]MBA8932570.1 glycerophosphoryl diester phosphodiesterase [Clostridium beijerinckii]NRT37469.1 glycerophosphoryl diester phosphodiesterase [Clostridium beijerinckii]NRT48789.1 glycerophosphoryl diester phosphodiesterase [Clostridium beijerinckii]NRT90836.1 glycerophosphoryl diester phosphodiesterase [Clostridium beijerinckii]NRU36774.1 glycerophosphoryl diester phosphodiesterase [Clostridium beijerinckii]
MKILNIAHRGYSGKFDENTILAFKKAIEYNADGIEADVQLSKDGVPIIIHDETLDRTTNGHGFVKDYTLDELKIFRTKSVPEIQVLKNDSLQEMSYLKLNMTTERNNEEDKQADSYKVGKYTMEELEYFQNRGGDEIPTLRELLQLVADSGLKVLNLELKNSVIEYKGLEKKVLAMIDEYDLRDKVIISSFNHTSLVKVRKLENNKKITLGALTETILVNVPKYLKAISVDCYHPHFSSILNEEYMKEIKDAGIRVNPYTVNSLADMKKVIMVGVDSIITNEVELLNTLL